MSCAPRAASSTARRRAWWSCKPRGRRCVRTRRSRRVVVLARRLHLVSARRGGPFVVVNCPTLSEDLLASELFGHTRAAFTGAVRDQAGRVEAAEHAVEEAR